MKMLEEAVDCIYEAAFVPEAWPDAFARLASLSGAASSAFVMYKGDGRPRFKSHPLLEAALKHFTTTTRGNRVRKTGTHQQSELVSLLKSAQPFGS